MFILYFLEVFKNICFLGHLQMAGFDILEKEQSFNRPLQKFV